MTTREEQADRRLLIVGDLQRLGPLVADCFSPHRIDGVHTYLDGIAEIPRSPTRAVLVGHDPHCRKPEAAISAMRQVAGDAPLVVCCEPAYESVGRRLVQHGADAYVIFPPDATDLEDVLGIPSRRTQRRWIERPQVVPVPSAEELERLSDVLPRLSAGSLDALDALAALICTALNAEDATILIEGRVGRAGYGVRSAEQAALLEPITREDRRVGQIRVGPSRSGGFTHEDTAKLRHYGVLIGRLIEGAERVRYWQNLALTDDLTGLPNRRHLLQFLEEKLTQARELRITVTALVFDIDDFKRYNDTYGHDAGDEILIEVGRLFEKCSRKTDLVARYGGDEFIVIFWDPEGPRTLGSQHPEGFVAVVQRFREALKGHTFTRLGPEAQGCLTISGGLAHFPWQANTAVGLIEAADQALLQAKVAGKNRFWVIGDGPIAD